MIWLRRLLPLLLIGLGWLGYRQYEQYRTQRFQDEAQRYALVTAQVWLASAQYRDDRQRFLDFRDSLLDAAGLSRREVDEYLKRYQTKPEAYTPYARLVKKYVDSLSGATDEVAIDSLAVVLDDSTTNE